MLDQLILVTLGFILTSVAGGFLGYYFQRRTWDANRRESERQAAAGVFDDISRAMDRRIYRMWLLLWSLNSRDEERVQGALIAYREVLEEWNDNLNRNLALAFRYFGEGVWNFLDKVLYEDFARLGREIEARYKSRASTSATSSASTVSDQLRNLNDEVYSLNRFMISLVQHGRVGLYQGSKKRSQPDWPEHPPWHGNLREGTKGPRVVQWQRYLNEVHKGWVVEDGWFGPSTSEATDTFQRNHKLKPDGVVDVTTRRKMEEVATPPPRTY